MALAAWTAGSKEPVILKTFHPRKHLENHPDQEVLGLNRDKISNIYMVCTPWNCDKVKYFKILNMQWVW